MSGYENSSASERSSEEEDSSNNYELTNSIPSVSGSYESDEENHESESDLKVKRMKIEAPLQLDFSEKEETIKELIKIICSIMYIN